MTISNMSSNTTTTTTTAETSSTPKHYADDPSRFPMEGGCCCGQTRYRLDRAPLVSHCCHCTSCQRETGSAFVVNLMVEAATVVLLPPAPAALPASPAAPDVFPTASPLVVAPPPPSSSPLLEEDRPDATRLPRPLPSLVRATLPQESGDPQTVSHCPACLTAVWTEYGSFGPSVRFLRGGTLDRAWLVRPDVHLFVRSKRDFVRIADDDATPRFEGYYDRRKVWRAESLARWDAVVLPGIRAWRESQGLA